MGPIGIILGAFFALIAIIGYSLIFGHGFKQLSKGENYSEKSKHNFLTTFVIGFIILLILGYIISHIG